MAYGKKLPGGGLTMGPSRPLPSAKKRQFPLCENWRFIMACQSNMLLCAIPLGLPMLEPGAELLGPGGVLPGGFSAVPGADVEFPEG